LAARAGNGIRSHREGGAEPWGRVAPHAEHGRSVLLARRGARAKMPRHTRCTGPRQRRAIDIKGLALSIGVVHLVRRGNPPELLERFLRSYAGHPAGIEHQLVIALKGFATERPPELGTLLEQCRAQVAMIPDRGYDVQSYALLASRLDHRYLCFLNSHTEVLVDDWLLKLHDALRQPSVGLVGATGSWQGYFRNYNNAKPDLGPLALERSRLKAALVEALPVISGLQSEVLGRLLRRHFPPFPNPHVRTTGFLCEREIVAGARGARARTKLGAYAFESGSHGLTAQVNARGLAARVVSASGESFDADQWFAASDSGLGSR